MTFYGSFRHSLQQSGIPKCRFMLQNLEDIRSFTILVALLIKCTITTLSILLFDGMSARLFLNSIRQKTNDRRSRKCRMIFQIIHLYIPFTEHLQVPNLKLEGIYIYFYRGLYITVHRYSKNTCW